MGCESVSIRPENTVTQFKCVARIVWLCPADGPQDIKENFPETVATKLGGHYVQRTVRPISADGPVSWILVKRTVRPGIPDSPPYIFQLDQGRSVRPTG